MQVCNKSHLVVVVCFCEVKLLSRVRLFATRGLWPTKLLHPGDSPGRNTGVGCHFLLQCMKVQSESEVTQSCPTPSDPMDCSPQAPPSMGFSRQECWSGVPLPSPIIVTKGCFIAEVAEPQSYLLFSSVFKFIKSPLTFKK